MDDSLSEVIMTGRPVETKDTLATDLRDYYLYGKAQWQFTCPVCDRTYKTKGEYQVSDNGVVEGEIRGTQVRFRRMIRGILSDIPIVGTFMSSRVDGAISDKLSESNVRRSNEFRQRAFGEIADSFSACKCRVCGKYSCKECFSEDLCGRCSETKRKREDTNLVFAQQVEQMEGSFRRLIEMHPEQKEVLEKQMRDAIDAVRYAQRQGTQGTIET